MNGLVLIVTVFPYSLELLRVCLRVDGWCHNVNARNASRVMYTTNGSFPSVAHERLCSLGVCLNLSLKNIETVEM